MSLGRHNSLKSGVVMCAVGSSILYSFISFTQLPTPMVDWQLRAGVARTLTLSTSIVRYWYVILYMFDTCFSLLNGGHRTWESCYHVNESCYWSTRWVPLTSSSSHIVQRSGSVSHWFSCIYDKWQFCYNSTPYSIYMKRNKLKCTIVTIVYCNTNTNIFYIYSLRSSIVNSCLLL